MVEISAWRYWVMVRLWLWPQKMRVSDGKRSTNSSRRWPFSQAIGSICALPSGSGGWCIVSDGHGSGTPGGNASIFAEPSNFTPLIVLAVFSFVAVAALPDSSPERPPLNVCCLYQVCRTCGFCLQNALHNSFQRWLFACIFLLPVLQKG